jgi:transcriptional regulator GlxA family with amidase domain
MANDQKDVPLQYGLLLFPNFEVLDAAGPIEVLNVLSFYFDHQEINLSVIAQTMDPVSPGPIPPQTKSAHFTGQQLYQPTHTFETAPVLDVLIVPGGRGTARSDEELKPLLNFIRKTYHGSDGKQPLRYLFSICTGSDLFARAGVLDGEKATTNKRAWERVTPHGPKTHWIAKARWVESNRVWTTSGVSAGTDGMVALVSKIYGDEIAGTLCNFIEHERVKDSGNDPFADMNGCKDVLPVSA